MKCKVLFLLATSLLLTGCIVHSSTASSNNSEGSSINSSDSIISSDTSVNSSSETSVSSESSESSSSSEDVPIPEYGYDFYGGYYGELTWDDGEDLKEKLYNIIRNGYQPLSYVDPNWETNVYADHDINNYLYLNVIYSSNSIDATRTQKGWQREHAFPASLMTGSLTSDATKTLGRATDFHNLFASFAKANSSRGNKNYGVANPDAEGYQNCDDDFGGGYLSDAGTFEPGDLDKGRVARAIFYMCTMYSKDEQDAKNGILMKGLTVQEEPVSFIPGDNCAFSIGHLSDLLMWNEMFEVDYQEMQHNESIFSHVYSKNGYAQGNRNPFVDYPELVDYIFGNKQDESGDLADIRPSCLDLNTHVEGFSHYALYSAKTEMSYGDTLTKDDYTLYSVNNNFSYLIAPQSEYHSDYDGHTFTDTDGDDGVVINRIYDQNGNPITFYEIVLDPMQTCDTYYSLNKSTIDASYAKVGIDQTIQYNEDNFVVNADVTYTNGDTSKKWTLQNISTGGFKMGSGTYVLNKFTLKSTVSYSVDKIYIKAYAANQSSSYTLKILVGNEQVYTTTVDNNSGAWKIYGVELGQIKTGTISFVFEGSNSLSLHSISWNTAN